MVSKRLSDLLLACPASAIEGVQWTVLIQKYEERYTTHLDLAALGFSSPLAAATTLLWDVVRVIGEENKDNPIVGIEDAVALAPQPGLMGCWPSLYHALCEIVLENGKLDPVVAHANGDSKVVAASPTRILLLSQLKPLLKRHWHTNFEENGLGYLNEEGVHVRLKKMKHLVHIVLQWREQRVAWRKATGLKPSATDDALKLQLELTASKQHNDLVLRCSAHYDANESVATIVTAVGSNTPPARAAVPSKFWSESDTDETDSLGSSTSAMESELVRLRAENAHLRSWNEFFQHSTSTPLLCMPFINSGTPATNTSSTATPVEQPATPRLSPDVFDDPFEPPPEARVWKFQESVLMAHAAISNITTGAGSEREYGNSSCSSTCATPSSTCAKPNGTSDVTSPSFVPMWFSLIPSSAHAFNDIRVIPNGIVQQIRARFEHVQN